MCVRFEILIQRKKHHVIKLEHVTRIRGCMAHLLLYGNKFLIHLSMCDYFSETITLLPRKRKIYTLSIIGLCRHHTEHMHVRALTSGKNVTRMSFRHRANCGRLLRNQCHLHTKVPCNIKTMARNVKKDSW